MAIKRVSPVDTAWLLIENRDTPMHVGALLEFTKPDGAEPDYLGRQLERMREERRIPRPWNLRPVNAPLVGPRVPLMSEDTDIDLSYHVRHLALPQPGGQRELGILISRLHSHQLDMHRPLWEMHLIEGLGENGFAMYMKIHHSLIDGVSGMKLLLKTLSADPDGGDTPAFWTVGEGSKPGKPVDEIESSEPAGSVVGSVVESAVAGASTVTGLGRAALELGASRIREGDLAVPYDAPDSALGGRLGGQRRFATQQYDLEEMKSLAKASGGTLNDIVLYLSSSALRRYLKEHGVLPSRSLTAGIPVSLREAGDESTGTSVCIVVTELATNYGDPRERLEAIQASMSEAKNHVHSLPPAAKESYTLLLNAPFITSLLAGLGGRTPVPFNVTVSNVPGPSEPLYFSGSRLDRLSPLSLLPHGTALNITCVSYAGTMNFGLTGARDSLPHLQRLAIYMGEELELLKEVLLEPAASPKKQKQG